MALRGFRTALTKQGIWARRLAVGSDGTAPVYPPLYIKPTAAPTATAAAGDFYVDSTTNLLMVSDGSAYSGPMAKRVVKNGAATLTKADSGAVCIFGTAAGYTYTLPPAETGLWFDFLVGITITSVAAKTICTSGDFLLGNFIQSTDGTYTSASHAADGSTIVAISMNGTTTGGLVGDWYRVVAISGTQWYIWGMGRATGSEATPFATS